MDSSFDVSLEFTLAEEGGFIDHPTDPRFATNFGITLARLRRFLRDPTLGRDDIRHVSCATVRAVYIADFWNRVRCDALPPGVDLMMFDQAVNAGPDRAGRALQLAVGQKRADVDGAVGPDTMSRVALADTLTLLDAVTAMQRTSYRQMAAFGLFGDGWLARLDRRRTKALELMALAEPVSRR
ncbi:MAG: glycosyl hydrolase 108 family protein [Acetobacteraceae bacterium]|jgi:lysozyme family protein